MRTKKKKKKFIPLDTFNTAFVRKSNMELKNHKINSTKTRYKKDKAGVTGELAARLKEGTVRIRVQHCIFASTNIGLLFLLLFTAN